jgi:hypothetical protein
MSLQDLLQARPRVINVGLESFARDLSAAGVAVAHVDWTPPARGDSARMRRLEALMDDERVATANAEALARMLAADPVLVDVQPAAQVIPALSARDRLILHAGPPIGWADMCGPLQGAVMGAIVLEGWAADLDAAARLAASGAITFEPNHHHDAVGPMTGLITRSMPVMVVENRKFGNRAYCTLNEGLGKVMRFGGNDADVLARLRWLGQSLAPVLAAALRQRGGVALKGLVARGLAMGDELHQRNAACTSLLIRELAPSLARTSSDGEQLARALEFMAGNDQFFLNVAMVMGKAIMDPVRSIAGSSVVVAMCRNGTEFGIRLAGTGDRWFTAPVEQPKGLYFPGYTADDANPDIGDSTIVETIGLGGFAMGTAPAVAGFVGAGTAADAANYTRAMTEITTGRNPDWTMPALDFMGAPTGIDVRKVVATGIVPIINTGIAHRKPGVGQVGAGTVRAPFACFTQALDALATELGAP